MFRKAYYPSFSAVLTDRWSTFYKTRVDYLIQQHLLSSAINKKRELWKVQCGSTVEGILHNI